MTGKELLDMCFIIKVLSYRNTHMEDCKKCHDYGQVIKGDSKVTCYVTSVSVQT